MKKIFRRRFLFVVLLIVIIIQAGFSGTQALTVVQADPRTGNITVDGEVSIDDNLAAAGNVVTINGTIADTLFVAGSTIRQSGSVNGNLVAAGANLSISGDVGQDAIVAGNTVDVQSGSVITRDLVSTGNIVTIDGTVNRNVLNSSGQLIINGTIQGNVITTAAAIQFGGNARVEGDFTYYSDQELNIPAEQVGGQIQFQRMRERPRRRGDAFFAGFMLILASLLLGIIIALLAPLWLGYTTQALIKSPWKCLGWGFLILVAIPIIAALIAFTFIGLPIAILLLLLYIITIIVAEFVTAFYIGSLIGKNRNWSPVITMLLGVLILQIIFLIPFIGFLARLVAVSLGLGAIILINPLKTARSRERITPESGIPEDTITRENYPETKYKITETSTETESKE